MADRPWLVTAKSDQYEWNGRVGRRFATEVRALAVADQMREDAYREVRVWYAPVSEEIMRQSKVAR